MRKLEETEERIRNLSGTELVEFRKWYVETVRRLGIVSSGRM